MSIKQNLENFSTLHEFTMDLIKHSNIKLAVSKISTNKYVVSKINFKPGRDNFTRIGTYDKQFITLILDHIESINKREPKEGFKPINLKQFKTIMRKVEV